MKSMSRIMHFPPFARYFSSVYKPFVHYICIYIYICICEALYYYCRQSSAHHHWYAYIPQITYFQTVTVVHPDVLSHQSVTHNFLVPAYIHIVYLPNRSRALLRHRGLYTSREPTRERSEHLEPRTDGNKRLATHLYRSKKFVLLDHLGKRLTHSISPSLQQRRLLDRGHYLKGRGTLPPRINL